MSPSLDTAPGRRLAEAMPAASRRRGSRGYGKRSVIGLTLAVTATAVLLISVAPTLAGSSGLHYSTASNTVVQRQPAPGACHAVGHGLYSRPDPRCTPGALNPQVTQATIAHTICRAGWTATVRPPETVTEPEKLASMSAYRDVGGAWEYEYDHLVPLELGGATNDPRNLWPEPGGSPNPKDRVENQLNHAVCDGEMTLAQAQREIAANWVALAHRLAKPARKAHRRIATAIEGLVLGQRSL